MTQKGIWTWLKWTRILARMHRLALLRLLRGLESFLKLRPWLVRWANSVCVKQVKLWMFVLSVILGNPNVVLLWLCVEEVWGMEIVSKIHSIRYVDVPIMFVIAVDLIKNFCSLIFVSHVYSCAWCVLLLEFVRLLTYIVCAHYAMLQLYICMFSRMYKDRLSCSPEDREDWFPLHHGKFLSIRQ